MIRATLAALIDRVINALAPAPVDRARQLAEYEAGIDAFEPDELWAAAHLKPPAATSSPFPPGAATPLGGGGPISRCGCTFDPPLADWEQELHNSSSHHQ